MKNPLRMLALLYSMLLLGAASWALWTNASFLHSSTEHLLPDMAMTLLAFPTSLSLSWVYETWPQFFSRPLAQSAWLACCGLFQASILFFLSAFTRMKRTKNR
jgi:hypothetical protein